MTCHKKKKKKVKLDWFSLIFFLAQFNTFCFAQLCALVGYADGYCIPGWCTVSPHFILLFRFSYFMIHFFFNLIFFFCEIFWILLWHKLWWHKVDLHGIGSMKVGNLNNWNNHRALGSHWPIELITWLATGNWFTNQTTWRHF